MGSVPSLYTTGDNDPEIEPVQYYRHYFYCDECGAFDIEPWMEPEEPRRTEASRRKLAKAAGYATLPTAVAAWLAVGLSPFVLSFVMVTIFGIALYPALRATGPFAFLGRREERAEHRSLLGTLWSRALVVLPWAVAALGSELLVLVVPWPYWVSAVAGAVLVAGLLTLRAGLGRGVEVLGVRCRACGARYPGGSSFLADLDANPRGFGVDDVPRPLGVSYFQVGRTVGPGSEGYEPPPAPRGVLPP